MQALCTKVSETPSSCLVKLSPVVSVFFFPFERASTSDVIRIKNSTSAGSTIFARRSSESDLPSPSLSFEFENKEPTCESFARAADCKRIDNSAGAP